MYDGDVVFRKTKQLKHQEEMGDIPAAFDRSNDQRQTLTEHHPISTH